MTGDDDGGDGLLSRTHHAHAHHAQAHAYIGHPLQARHISPFTRIYAFKETGEGIAGNIYASLRQSQSYSTLICTKTS